MTIRDANNFCPTCNEVCHHHPTTCTVCGTTLGPAPVQAAQPPANDNNSASSAGISPIPEALGEETRAAARELRRMVSSLQEQREILANIRHDQQELMEQVQAMRQEWQTVPAALLDPQQAGAGGTPVTTIRPTSKAFLGEIPRVVLKEHSPLLYQATLSVEGLPDVRCILGDFDMELAPQEHKGCLVLAQSPRTCRGGLNSDTKLTMAQKKNNGDNVMLCVERGDGVTFVQKALLAQQAGAIACIVGNHVAEPWPYVMKDSANEAQKHGLTIPTVIIKKADAERLWNLDDKQHKGCCLRLTQPARDCVVCTDSLTSGAKVLRLPPCGHLFHEACVLQWLDQHNTCPFCRRELPTDDPAYEQERRRAQRTHAGSTAATTNEAYADFYG